MSAGKCPICGRPAEPDQRPFCSRRCAALDLQRWFSGAYAVPAVEDEAEPDHIGRYDSPGDIDDD